MTDKLKPAKLDDPEQSKRFIDMAREVEVDERPDAFEKVFKKVTQAPPPQNPAKPSS
jgi:hypothetical protein